MRKRFFSTFDPKQLHQRTFARLLARQIANTENVAEIIAAQSGILPSEAERRFNDRKGARSPKAMRDKIRAVLADMKKRGYFAPDLTEAVSR